MCSHSSPDRERRTVPLKRSTADSSIYAGPRWDSATSRITSRGVCSSPVASDRFYTLNYDEPLFCIHGCFFIHGRGCCLPPFRCGRGGIRLMPVTIVLAVLPTRPVARPRSIAHTPYVAHSHQ